MRIGQITTALLFWTVWSSSSGWSQEPRYPLPDIRQVWLDSKDATVALGTGSWSMVSRREFTRTLETVQKVAQAERRLPWLLSAQYDARIDGLQMLGTAQLLLHNPHEIAAWAILSPWTMPLRPRSEVFDQMKLPAIRSVTERSLGLLTGPNTNQTDRLAWSIQGEERSDGRWFQLQLPACPQATMNIVVPLPYRLDWPSARQHLRGPFPVEGESARRWQLQLGGEARHDIQVVLRPPSDENQASWMEARLDADFIVHDQEVRARYEIDVHRWHDRLRAITLDLPESLIIKSLAIRQFGTDLTLPYQRLTAASMDITFPESIEQRATVVMEASWKIRSGERLVFHTPGLRGSVSVKPTIHVVSMAGEPLVDWQWGDYFPLQMASQDDSAHVLTLSPRLILDSSTLKPPSARQVQRTMDLNYHQDTWWMIGKHTQQLTVRCQCNSSQRPSEYLSWQVPAGWSVRSVTSDSATPVQAWTWHAGYPLEVQWPISRKTGEKSTIMVQLEPSTPMIVTEEPRVWFIPHLVPVIPGRFTGSYAISMERKGDLMPPSLVVIKSPGIRISPPASETALWSTTNIVPDLYWQLQDTSGSVQLQDWPATVRASLVTEVIDSERMSSLQYRMKLRPLAGVVIRWPVAFSSSPAELKWTSTPKRMGENWKQLSANSGQFTWHEPLDAPVELEAEIPWHARNTVPLLSSPMPFDARLKLGRFLTTASDWAGKNRNTQIDDSEAVLWYDKTTPSPVIERLIREQIELTSPRIDTSIHGSIAESTYSTIIPVHQDALQLTLPEQGELITYEIDGMVQTTRNPITIPSSLQPIHLLLKYRSMVNDGLLLSTWQPVLPAWNKDASPSPLHLVVPDHNQVTIWGALSSSDRTPKSNPMIWVSRHIIFALTIVMMGASWCLLRQRVLRRLRIPFVLACCLLLMGSNFSLIAQGERATFVYILPGESGNENDERVMVPASLWKQIQIVAKQTTAGLTKNWWVSDVSSEGELNVDRLTLKSKWSVTLGTDETVDIPWLDSRPPEEVTIDKETVHPRLINKPFGIQQWVIPIKRKGSHEMIIKWDIPIKQDGSMHSAEIANPGAPSQRLTIHHVPDKLYLQGTQGHWKLEQLNGVQTLIAETGLAKSVSLSWPLRNDTSPDVVVDVGVLWEHRIHQSIAHAVLSYHIERGVLDQFTMELPADLRIRNLSIAGETQTAATPRIKRWRIEQVANMQRLQVFLQRPVHGTVHLLLEMPSQRDARANTVLLEQVRPLEAVQRHGILAFLADGVLVEPVTPLQVAQTHEIDFARPWLPSLASLPASCITRAVTNNSTIPQLRLLPLPTTTLIKAENHIVLEPQSVQYRFKIEAKSHRPLIYLDCHVDPGLMINEVVGSRVSRWFQTTAKPDEPSQLSIWFTPGNGQSQEATFTIAARQPVEVNDEQHQIRLPVKQIKWDSITSEPSLLKLFSSRSGKAINIQTRTPLRAVPGPWNETNLIAAYELPATLTPGSTILVQEDTPLVLPKAIATWDDSMTEKRWVLTVSAPAGGVLPTQLEMLALNDHLEQGWQFEANAPLTFRPSRSLGRAVLWSIQLSKPVNKVQIKCYPLRDAQGKVIQPSVSFPAWSGMTITPAE